MIVNINSKKGAIVILLISLSISCQEKTKPLKLVSEFSTLNCDPDSLPKYDGDKVTLFDEHQNPIKDTIMNRIEKRRTVFKPCRELIYSAIWRDENAKIITNSGIKMMANGLRWGMQPQKQDEIIIQFEYSANDIQQCINHQLNKGILDWEWKNMVVEGVIENVEEIWMHPFRHNQYNFTEVAPFPEVKLPLEMGKKWTSNLRIMEGWGDWSHSSGNFEYEIKSKETLNFSFGTLEDCWHIVSESSYPFGDSTLEYWFHDSLGFVKKVYHNYGNQSLVIELEEIIDRD